MNEESYSQVSGDGKGARDAVQHVFIEHKFGTGGFCLNSHSCQEEFIQKQQRWIIFTREYLQWEDNWACLCNVWMQKLTQSWLQWINTLTSASRFFLLWPLSRNLRCDSSDLLTGEGLPSKEAWEFHQPTAVSPFLHPTLPSLVVNLSSNFSDG